MADRSRPYHTQDQFTDVQGFPGSEYANGYAGPYENDIPMEQIPSNSGWNQYGDNEPRHRYSSSRNPRPRSDGYATYDPGQGPSHHAHTWEAGDNLRETAELLESLPSRQLDALASSGKHSLRHRRHKSYHGTIRLPPEEVEALGRSLEEDSEMEEEEMEEMIRGMPTTLTSKRQIKRHMSSRKRKKRLGRCTQLKYSCGMGWQHFKDQVAEITYSLELWRSHLKKIEGHFGTGVKSYFLFLKWLFLINIPIFLLTFGFVIIPQILQRWYEKHEDREHATVKMMNDAYNRENVSFTGIELITGAGWFEDTELYYGFYKNVTVELFEGVQYKMNYAYLFTCGGYYLLCLLIMAHSILRSYRKYYIEGSSEFSFFFVSKVFCGWDYGITAQEAAQLKHRSVYNELREYLSGKKTAKKKTMSESCQVFWIRVLTNLFVIGLLGGSGYLVYEISINQSLQSENQVLDLLALPLVITAIHLLLPFIFTLVERLERYEMPKNELYMHMLRTMTLRATNLAVLVYFWFIKAPQEKECWETFMGEEIYRLVIIDFLFTLLYTFFFEFVRKLMSKYCCKEKLQRAEFGIGRNTLDLIYSQALCWLGTFYCPLLSFIVIIKFWIIFYVKRISVIQNCKPSMRPWRAARSHTIFLGFLFCFFLLTTAAVILGIIFITPSETCGPYREETTTYSVVTNLVKSWQGKYEWLKQAIYFITSPGFIAGLVILLCMGTYYMRIAMIGHREMVTLLQDQLALEGKDKNFLLKLLQEVSKKNKHTANNNNRPTRINQGGDTSSQFTSPDEEVDSSVRDVRFTLPSDNHEPDEIDSTVEDDSNL